MSTRRPFTTWTGSEDGKPIVPKLSFRVFAEGNPHRFFVEVYVWEHLWQMRALKTGDKRRTRAFWHAYLSPETRIKPDKLGRPVVSRKLGEMHLCLKTCTYNTVAHEAYHATRTFARRSGTIEAGTLEEAAAEDVHTSMPEEVNARFHGYLTDRIVMNVMNYFNRRKK